MERETGRIMIEITSTMPTMKKMTAIGISRNPPIFPFTPKMCFTSPIGPL